MMTEEQHQSSSSLDSSGAFDAGAAQDFAGEAREHVVVPGDTLAGLCLKYAVSARALRTLNKLDGDNVQGRTRARTLIPTPTRGVRPSCSARRARPRPWAASTASSPDDSARRGARADPPMIRP